MDKEVARQLLPIVNDHVTMGIIQQYINSRIEALRDTLEQVESAEARGAIRELRRFVNLRDEAIKNSR
jgi:hypothetical protein